MSEDIEYTCEFEGCEKPAGYSFINKSFSKGKYCYPHFYRVVMFGDAPMDTPTVGLLDFVKGYERKPIKEEDIEHVFKLDASMYPPKQPIRMVSRKWLEIIEGIANAPRVYTFIPMRERMRRAWRDKNPRQLLRTHDVHIQHPKSEGKYGIRMTEYVTRYEKLTGE